MRRRKIDVELRTTFVQRPAVIPKLTTGAPAVPQQRGDCMTKRTFSNGKATIEVSAHASSMGPTKVIDHLAIITILDGDEKAARELFDEVKAKYLNRPYQDWL